MPSRDNSVQRLSVFLCHSSGDKPAVRELHRKLSADGFQPWLDEVDILPGRDWELEIRKAVKEAHVVLVCLSQDSVSKRGYIQKEIKMVLDEADEQLEGDIFLIPLRLEDCDVPDRLSRWQWVDYFQDPGNGYQRVLLSLNQRCQDLGIPVPSMTVDSQGKVKDRQTRQAEYRTEDLGNGVTLDMVQIPGGFLMPPPDEGIWKTERPKHPERPKHTVFVESFWMSKYPVTQAQWKMVAGFDKVARDLRQDPSEFKGSNRPVEKVSWYDAIEFCQRLSQKIGREHRLPSEAEWEYACRARTTTPYHFGETISKDLASYDRSPGEGTTEVGKFQPNAFGLYDMHGNVWEWCLDHWHENYEGVPTDGGAWTEGGEYELRVLRGESWASYPGIWRSARRYRLNPVCRVNDIGFRVCCSSPRTP